MFQSSRQEPDGSDYDQFVWDNFSFASSRTLTEIRWRGGFDPVRNGSGGPVNSFKISIHASIPAGTQPDIPNPPLVEYLTVDNAGQTPAGSFGGIAMYDYAFTLPAPFIASAGTRYWVQIEANQSGIPDWGLTSASTGDGFHFAQLAAAADKAYRRMGSDVAFTLLGDQPPVTPPPPPPPQYTVSLPFIQRQAR